MVHHRRKDRQPSSVGPDEVVILDRGTMKKAKDCVHCGRVMTWRKKWEQVGRPYVKLATTTLHFTNPYTGFLWVV